MPPTPRADSSNLDFMRAMAVMCVFGAHLTNTILGGPLDSHPVTWRFGQLGVIIFFVHTALVLMRSLERSRLDGWRWFADFYTRRAWRIYPLAIATVTAYVLWQGGWSLTTYLAHITLTTNLFYIGEQCCSIWTLPLEVQMYAVLPVLFLLLRARSIGMVLVVYAAWVGLSLVQQPLTLRLNVISYAPCFMGGVLAWHLSRRWAPRLPGWLWPVAFVSVWPIWLAVGPWSADHFYYRWAFCLVLGASIPWFRDITWKPAMHVAQIVAKYSYGVYLSHQTLFQFAMGLDLSHRARMTVIAVLAIALPVAMFHLIEQPGIRVGQRVAAWLKPRPSPAFAVAGASAVSEVSSAHGI